LDAVGAGDGVAAAVAEVVLLAGDACWPAAPVAGAQAQIAQAASNAEASATTRGRLTFGGPRRAAAGCPALVPSNRAMPIGRHRSRELAGPG